MLQDWHIIKNPRSSLYLFRSGEAWIFYAPNRGGRGYFVPTLHSVFWVTYNWSYKYAYTCAFMHLFLRYAAPNN